MIHHRAARFDMKSKMTNCSARSSGCRKITDRPSSSGIAQTWSLRRSGRAASAERHKTLGRAIDRLRDELNPER
jgi:hypothetical protein